MRRRIDRRVTGAALAVVLLFAGTACGDDDDGDSGANRDAWCEANTELSLAFASEDPDPDAIAPLLEEFTATAPQRITEEAEVVVNGAEEALGGNEDVFEDPEFVEANNTVNELAFEGCDFASKGQVTTVDYAFENMPDEISAGVSLVKVTNAGEEIHEMVLVRKGDDVTQSFEEILQLPQEEASQLVGDRGTAFVGEPGNTTYLYADLDEGEYAAVCFIPVGATSFEVLGTLGEDAPPHVVEGMIAEFTVT